MGRDEELEGMDRADWRLNPIDALRADQRSASPPLILTNLLSELRCYKKFQAEQLLRRLSLVYQLE